ncbi:hypothetical protein CSB37_01300 [bacterium DOLZORAL124_38_8]|nr:MAG: hypothetical protein CSB37_01300 [bacterium DOLZORAL124_38_8]
MKILLVFGFKVLQILINLLTYALFFHIILSWLSQGRTTLGMYLEAIVQPLLRPFRWARIGMFDFSVLIVYLILQYGGNFVLKTIAQFL